MKTLEQRIRARRLRNDILFALAAVALICGFVWAVIEGVSGNKEYNDHVCQTYYGGCND